VVVEQVCFVRVFKIDFSELLIQDFSDQARCAIASISINMFGRGKLTSTVVLLGGS